MEPDCPQLHTCKHLDFRTVWFDLLGECRGSLRRTTILPRGKHSIFITAQPEPSACILCRLQPSLPPLTKSCGQVRRPTRPADGDGVSSGKASKLSAALYAAACTERSLPARTPSYAVASPHRRAARASRRSRRRGEDVLPGIISQESRVRGRAVVPAGAKYSWRT